VNQQWPRDILRLRDEYLRSRDQFVTLRLFDAFPVRECGSSPKNEGCWVSTEMGSHGGNLSELHAAGLLTAEHGFRRESIRKALSLGIRPGLSMDNEISYGIDMFVEMQTLLIQQRSRDWSGCTSHIRP